MYERKQKEYHQSAFWLFREFFQSFLFQRKVKQHRILDFYLFRLQCNRCINRACRVFNSSDKATISYNFIKLGTLSHSSSQNCPIPYSFPPSIWLRFFKSSVLSNWDIFIIINIHSFWYRLNMFLTLQPYNWDKNLGNEASDFSLLKLNNLVVSHFSPSNVLKGFFMKRKEIIVCSSFIV